MALESVKPVCDFINSLRNYGFAKLIIAGGHGATMSPNEILVAGANAVVLGEGEITFRDIIEYGITKNVNGIKFIDNGTFIETSPRKLIQNLDLLKKPVRNFTNINTNYMSLLETSRGCRHTCTFCESSRFYKGIWRGRTPEVVVNDIQHLVENNIHVIQITDDNFTASPMRALKISKLLQKGPLPVYISFSGRSDELMKIPELIINLAKAHFFKANIGIETLNWKLAVSIKKPISFEQHHKAISAMKEAGMFIVGSFIVGLPNETKKIRKKHVKLAVEVGVDSAQFIPFQPLPGTPLEKNHGKPKQSNVVASSLANSEFIQHPNVIRNLLQASMDFTIRGSFARASLLKYLKTNVFDSQKKEIIIKELTRIDPNILTQEDLNQIERR
ncbi:MAG: B12-binding domain-containing radical SAM protein [Candidatus Heimdallarchaeota archaeon]|nr:B12-binding domain-containing radical SAM protein [Candidatus Heimdallarchaeota archaeon]